MTTSTTPASTQEHASEHASNWTIAAARFKMIEQQIRPWGIGDTRFLDVLEVVKREFFVEESQIPLAFMDMQLPIHGSQEVMLEPRAEVKILQGLNPTGKEDVLEIGTGSGYMAALLGYFTKFVTTVEIREELIDFAVTNLNKCRIPNVKVDHGNAAKGWKEELGHTYDMICVSGGIPKVPESLKAQLRVGGKLFAYVGQEPVMSAIIMHRVSHDYFQTHTLFEGLVPMLQVNQSELETFEF